MRREEVESALKVVRGYLKELKETVAEISDTPTASAKSVAASRDDILRGLSDLVDISRDAREEFAVYLVTDQKVSREHVARIVGVSNMTVGRWVKRIAEPDMP